MAEGVVRHDRAGAVEVSRALLVQYRVMAFTTAVLLIILVFVGVPLQLAAGRRQVVNVVGTMHGLLYIVYLLAAFRLTIRLRVPALQTALVLLAGTIPFAAFVAERKMTRRFETTAGRPAPASSERARNERRAAATSVRRRWISPRALVLHLEVLVVAPGCAVAGWWQATRALAGNELSWFYSVEWPVFALLAIWGWWHLVHEDPDAYSRRKARAASRGDAGAPGVVRAKAPGAERDHDLDAATVRMARALLAAVGAEFLLGIAAMVSIPFARPNGWVPARGGALYAAHASLGLFVVFGAIVLLFRLRDAPRTARVVAWLGLVSLAAAGTGGLLTEARSTVRFFGMAIMLIGTAFAVFAYMIPTLLGASPRQAASAGPEPSG